LDCEITTINTSYVNSAGIIIFLAGSKRVGLEGASFFVHSVTKKLSGEFNYFELEREVKELQVNTNKISHLLEINTHKNSKYWKSLMKKGVVISTIKALEIGLITEYRVQ
jgi:ATP-dependent protease ClpP protease subunit